MPARPVGGTASVLYCSDLPSRSITTVVYVDSIVASGGTIDVARSILQKNLRPQREMLAVIASSSHATRRLAGDGMEIVGISLFEQIEGTLLAPDLGRLDAGDIFSGEGLLTDRTGSPVL